MKKLIISLCMTAALTSCGQKKSKVTKFKGTDTGVDSVVYDQTSSVPKRPVYSVVLNDQQWNLVLKVMDASAAGNLEVKQAIQWVYPQLEAQQKRLDSTAKKP